MAEQNLAGKSVGGYRLQERIGEGGTATVYKAEHPEQGLCALKILKESLASNETGVKRFLREAGYGNRVTHPSVVKTHSYGEDGELYYMALEWAAGVPLNKYLNKTGRVPPKTASRIVTQLSGALNAAHEVGIIHRDLKPENIMYDPETEVAKLLDFGIARDEEADPSERLTKAGFFVGTLQYVAPEALSGELVGAPADIYSLAKITYHMLAAESPHDGRSPRQLFQQLLTVEPTPLNQVAKGLKFPVALEQVVMKALSRAPEDRHKTVLAFAEDVEQAVGGGSGPGSEDGFMDKIKGVFSKKPK
jgi:serine/threonine protein kinase